MAKEQIKKGNDLMLFVDVDGTGTYKSVAFATNHTLTLSTETEEVQSKDSGYDGATMAKKTTWELTSENMYIESEFIKLFEKMYSNDKYLKVAFGTTAGDAKTGLTQDDQIDPATSNYTPATTGFIKYGTALISSLTLNAQAGENSTYSLTLTGSGSLTTTKPSN